MLSEKYVEQAVSGVDKELSDVNQCLPTQLLTQLLQGHDCPELDQSLTQSEAKTTRVSLSCYDRSSNVAESWSGCGADGVALPDATEGRAHAASEAPVCLP
jgi:hypothetical protein